MSTRCRKTFYTCLQIFNHNPESNEDIYWAHFETKTRPLKPLADHREDLVFPPEPVWPAPKKIGGPMIS